MMTKLSPEVEEHGERTNVAESPSTSVEVGSTVPDDGVSSLPRHPEMLNSTSEQASLSPEPNWCDWLVRLSAQVMPEQQVGKPRSPRPSRRRVPSRATQRLGRWRIMEPKAVRRPPTEEVHNAPTEWAVPSPPEVEVLRNGLESPTELQEAGKHYGIFLG